MLDDVAANDDVAAAADDADAVAVAEVKVALVVALGMFAGIESASDLDVVVILALDYLVENSHLHLIRIHLVSFVVCQKHLHWMMSFLALF